MSELVLCRAAGWLDAPEGESRESTIELIKGLVARIEEMGEEIGKYQAWATSCDDTPAVKAVIAELEALDASCTSSGLMWMREHCLGLLRGQLKPLPVACWQDVGFGFHCMRESGHYGPCTWDPKRLCGEDPAQPPEPKTP